MVYHSKGLTSPQSDAAPRSAAVLAVSLVVLSDVAAASRAPVRWGVMCNNKYEH